MDLKNLKLEKFPIELDLGIPYLADDIVKEMAVGPVELELPQKHVVVWEQLAGNNMPYAKGMLMIPLSSTRQKNDIPEGDDGFADWEDENAKEAIEQLARLFSDEIMNSLPTGSSAKQQAVGMLSGVNLVEGTVRLCIPLFSKDIGEWASFKDFLPFVRSRKPEYVALYPASRRGSGFIFRRMKPFAFDLSKFELTQAAVDEKRLAIFAAGLCPRMSEKPTRESFQKAQQIPVPMIFGAKNDVVGERDIRDPRTGKVKATRKDPNASDGPDTIAGMFAVSRQRNVEWERETPELWEKLYPRRFADLPGYLHPKTIAKLNAAFLTSKRRESGGAGGHAFFALKNLLKFRVPHYFIAPAMCEAITKTKFPEDLKPSEVPLPLPSMILVLPENQKFLMGIDGSPLAYIIINSQTSKSITEDTTEMLRMLDPKASDEAIAEFLKQAPNGPDAEVVFIGVSTNGSLVYEMAVHWPTDKIVTENAVADKMSGLPNFPAAAAFKLTEFVFNTLLYFNTVPRFMEEQRVHHSVKDKSPKAPKPSIDYWSPNIYGRTFALPPEPADDESVEGSSVSRQGRRPRPHLRWAHWRSQAHGPGMTLRKWIHIDFTWVMPGSDDEP